MTLEQLMAWNGKVPLPEYEALLKKLESKKRSLGRACDTVMDEEDSLAVLEDERGSERWQSHEKKRQSALKRMERMKAEIQALEESLAGAVK